MPILFFKQNEDFTNTSNISHCGHQKQKFDAKVLEQIQNALKAITSLYKANLGPRKLWELLHLVLNAMHSTPVIGNYHGSHLCITFPLCTALYLIRTMSLVIKAGTSCRESSQADLIKKLSSKCVNWDFRFIRKNNKNAKNWVSSGKKGCHSISARFYRCTLAHLED